MKTFLRTLLAVITAIVLFLIVIVIIVAISTREKAPDIEDNSYLLITLETGLKEYPPQKELPNILEGDVESLHRVLENLRKAAVDDRIDGIIFKIDGYSDYPANIEEIRYAIDECKNAGKKVYAYSTMMNRGAYFLAAACDSIFVPPSCYFNFTGFSASAPFIKGTLEKMGIQAELSKIKDYKSAAEILLEDKWTEPARENREWLLEERWNTFVEVVGNDRGLTEEQLTNAMQYALFSGEPDNLIEYGLIDGVAYWDEIKLRLNLDEIEDDEYEENERLVTSATYANVDPEDLDLEGDKKIAVVHAEGSIFGKKSGYDPLWGQTMGYETINKNLRNALEDEDVAAIVFRINSGGGDGMVSDIICRQIEIITKKKPVVISMVGVAASGGYEIAYKGSKLLANRSTYTGSIGSISGKFVMKELYNKLGITMDFISRGPNALIYSDYHNFTEEQWERFTENHWVHFNVWLADVAKYRGMTFEEAELLAHGRVWTGEQAAENGLIDEVGGLMQAVSVAKLLAEIPEDEMVTLTHYPEKKSFSEMLMSEDGPFGSYINYKIHHYFTETLTQRLEAMQQGRWRYWDEEVK
jgi:protease-4